MNVQTLVEPIKVSQAILGFSGWPDAGKTVERTLAELQKALPSQLAAVWDMDGFWNTDASRPQVFVQHGQIQHLDWPEYRFSLCTLPSGEPILIGFGPEPSTRWRTFTHELLTLLKHWGCEEIFLLGSLYDQIFHDEAIFSGIVQDSRSFNWVRELGCRQVEYKGPGGVHTAIMEAALDAGAHCLSIWAHYPFYLNSPHELLISHLLEMLGALVGAEFETGRLEQAWEKREKEIEGLIRDDQELRQTLEGMKRDDRLDGVGSLRLPAKVVRLDDFLKKRKE